MAQYRLLARIELIASREYRVTVSAIPLGMSAAMVRISVEATLDLAQEARDRLLFELGAEIRGLGHQVVDVEGA